VAPAGGASERGISITDERRKRLARLPIGEKLKLLEKLRERSLAIAKFRTAKAARSKDAAPRG